MGVSVVLYVQSLNALDLKQSLGQCPFWGRDKIIVHSGALISEFALYEGGRDPTLLPAARANQGAAQLCRF